MGRRKHETKNDKEITVSVSPWTDKKDGTEDVDFSLMLLQVREVVYGEIPGGKMELNHTGTGDAPKYLKTQDTATIRIIDSKADDDHPGFIYEFDVYITRRHYQNNILHLDFICIPLKEKDPDLVKGKNFYTALYSETYPSIWDAIQSTYPGPIDKRCETDIPNSDKVSVYRDNETAYEFVKRLGYSWKKPGVFAFGWEGLLLKELIGINSFGKKEDDDEAIERVRGDEKDWSQVSLHKLRYNKQHNTEHFNAWQDPNKDEDSSLVKSVTPDDWYKKVEPKHVTSSLTGRDYMIHGKDYEVMQKNREENGIFASSGGYSSITITGHDMTRRWKLGDVIMYERNRNDDSNNAEGISEGNVKPTRFLVASNEIFFSQNGASKRAPRGGLFEWTTVLWSVERETYNEELEDNPDNEQ